MKIKTAFTGIEATSNAVSDLKEQLSGIDAKLVIFFASSNHAPAIVSEAMKTAYPSAEVIGCTTSGEIVSGKMLDNSIVAMALTKEMVGDLKVEIATGIKDDINSVDSALKSFSSYFGESVRKMDYKKYVGLVLVDGLSMSEEMVMDRIGDHTNVLFVGGSAGDDLKFKQTHVYANGKTYSDAALLLLMKPESEFSILKTQSFKTVGKTLTVTKANLEKREIIEFDNKPATQAYAEALDVDEESLGDHVFHNPVGLMAGDEPYVRSPRIIDGKKMLFYCSMMEGMELNLLESTDIIADTKKALAEKVEEMGGVSGLINFHCILRTLELKEKKLTQEYGAIFSEIPTIGFSTYGECYLGHINQTSTMLLFK